MDTSILISRIIATIYISIGLGVLFNEKRYRIMLSDLLENSSSIIIGAYFAIVVGYLIISFHSIWEFGWRLIITLLGWIVLLKGIVLLVFPSILSMYKAIFSNRVFQRMLVPMLFLFGGLFFYLGFFH